MVFGQRVHPLAQHFTEWGSVQKELAVRSVVRVRNNVLTDDLQLTIQLQTGLVGIVVHIDEDGDYRIDFPGLVGLKCAERWFFANKLKYLKQLSVIADSSTNQKIEQSAT